MTLVYSCSVTLLLHPSRLFVGRVLLEWNIHLLTGVCSHSQYVPVVRDVVLLHDHVTVLFRCLLSRYTTRSLVPL